MLWQSGERNRAGSLLCLSARPERWSKRTYVYDWLFIRFEGGIGEAVTEGTVNLVNVREDSFLASVLSGIFSDPGRQTMVEGFDLPDWWTFKAGLKTFSLKGDEYNVKTTDPAEDIYGLPIHNPAGGALGTSFISLDGVHFSR